MNMKVRTVAVLCVAVACLLTSWARAQDWPQWRGSNRDAKASGFVAPATWPEQLNEQWKVTVGDGVSTPAIVDDKIYVFTRQEAAEVIRCLDAATGKEIWQDRYETAGASGPAASFSGPRSSPAVAEGKVVTLGVQGILSCYEAATGKLLWRKEDLRGSIPRFATSSSPIIVRGLCIAQLGGSNEGAIIAYDLTTGDEKWKWTGDSPAYGSPVLMTVDNTDVIVTPTEQHMVAVSVADGKSLWQAPFSQGRYNAATPIVDGQTIIYAAQGTTAEKFSLTGDGIEAEMLWNNSDATVMFNSPVLSNGLIFGLTATNQVFCVRAQTGETAWTAPLTAAATPQPTPEPQRGPGKSRRGGRGGGGGYGSIVDAGSVLFALTPTGTLVVFEPNDKEFKQLASYKVAAAKTYAYPVIAGNRVLIKDEDSLTLWTLESP
ncbi:MAG: PQQ-binding-like beta-propeller repeat protein [Pirellulaceae bacterium]